MTEHRAVEPMRERGSELAAWPPFHRAAFAVFVGCLLASLAWIVHPWFDMTVDAAIYIITARALAAGEGYAYLGEPFTVRPPGLPLLLTPLVGTLGTDFAALNLFVALWGVAGVVLLFVFARPRIGFWLALLVAAAIWLNPGYQRLSTQVMSDAPGAALLFVCLLVERWARAAPSRWRELVLGLCIGASCYVRALLFLLVPAIAVSRALDSRRAPESKRRRFSAREWLFAVIALAVIAPWLVRDRLVATPDRAEHTLLHSYRVALLHVDAADPRSPLLGPADLLARVPLRSRQLIGVLGSGMRRDYLGDFDPQGELQPAHVALALLALGSIALVLWRRREPAELFALGSIAVIVTYFGFGGRLVLPVYLIALPASVEVVRDFATRWIGARHGAIAAAVALSLLIAPDLGARRDVYELERDHRAQVELAGAVAGAVGPDERLGAPIGAYYSVFLERPVYSLRHLARRSRDYAALDRAIERWQLDAIVTSIWSPRNDPLTGHLRDRYGPPERVGSALIWRLHSR